MTIDDHDHEQCDPNDENCNYNRYATKKTLANGGFEIALLITNAVQLKVLLGNMSKQDPLWWVGLVLVCISIFIQVLNGCTLVLMGTNDITKVRRQPRLISLNNLSLIFSVLLAIVNVILNVIVVVDPQILSLASNVTKIGNH
jgi:hypothetical protein